MLSPLRPLYICPITLPLELKKAIALWCQPAAQMCSDALVTIPSATITAKIQIDQFSFQDDHTIVEVTTQLYNTCFGPLVGQEMASQSLGLLENLRRMIMTAIKIS